MKRSTKLLLVLAIAGAVTLIGAPAAAVFQSAGGPATTSTSSTPEFASTPTGSPVPLPLEAVVSVGYVVGSTVLILLVVMLGVAVVLTAHESRRVGRDGK